MICRVFLEGGAEAKLGRSLDGDVFDFSHVVPPGVTVWKLPPGVHLEILGRDDVSDAPLAPRHLVDLALSVADQPSECPPAIDPDDDVLEAARAELVPIPPRHEICELDESFPIFCRNMDVLVRKYSLPLQTVEQLLGNDHGWTEEVDLRSKAKRAAGLAEPGSGLPAVREMQRERAKREAASDRARERLRKQLTEKREVSVSNEGLALIRIEPYAWNARMVLFSKFGYGEGICTRTEDGGAYALFNLCGLPGSESTSTEITLEPGVTLSTYGTVYLTRGQLEAAKSHEITPRMYEVIAQARSHDIEVRRATFDSPGADLRTEEGRNRAALAREILLDGGKKSLLAMALSKTHLLSFYAMQAVLDLPAALNLSVAVYADVLRAIAEEIGSFTDLRKDLGSAQQVWFPGELLS